jgi:hypothetical protein
MNVRAALQAGVVGVPTKRAGSWGERGVSKRALSQIQDLRPLCLPTTIPPGSD